MPDSPEAGYAFWTHPDGTFRIDYSLSVFHEIDFYAGEGFRRIPHGGMEMGGLLFGEHAEGSARIEAFRPIECEHAFGPSFVLSDRDLQTLEQQLADAKADPDLSALVPLGWFVAHTRSDLAVNERELAWFDRLFPQKGKITVLAKPERFQPTRFAFLIRAQDGRLERDGRSRAIILPLPGRASGAANGPVPSIPAPRIASAPITPPEKTAQERARPQRNPELPARPARRQSFMDEMDEPAAAPERQVPVLAEPRGARDLEPPSRRVYGQTPALAAIPQMEEPRHSAGIDMFALGGYAARRRTDRGRWLPAGLRLFIVLLIAAALGCAAGYWAYIQLPSATIRLSVRPRGSALLVSWPPEQTRGGDYAT
ncbi:MAG: hypothetical protein ACRD4O_07635, partial [Bryobacteraceae bacterium]